MRPATMSDGGQRSPNAIRTWTVPTTMETTTSNTHPAASCRWGIYTDQMKRPAGCETRGPLYSVHRTNRPLPTNRKVLTTKGNRNAIRRYPKHTPGIDRYQREI